MHELSPEGPPCIIVEKVSKTKFVYIIGTTLHVHLLHLQKSEESESDSSLEVLGVVLKESTLMGGESTKGVLKEEYMEMMLERDLIDKEKENFKVMLGKHPSHF